MKTNTVVIKAKSLFIKSLDAQIRDAGGRGYNCSVTSEKFAHSCSVLYTFPTEQGFKSLVTQNEYQVGSVNFDSGTGFVYFHLERDRFELHIPLGPRLSGERSFSTLALGDSFDRMSEALKEKYPNRITWTLLDPFCEVCE